VRPETEEGQLQDRPEEQECGSGLSLGINHTKLWKIQDLMAKKDEILRKELLEAFAKSGKSYAETMKFLKER
jgi:hypothetical protein